MAELEAQLPEAELPAPIAPVGITTSMTTLGGLVPQNLQELWQLATIMSKSRMMPKGVEAPEAVCVAVQMGLEVGLSPMQAVQNIAVINGRPSLWGDAVLGLVRASGFLEDFDETFEGEGDALKAVCRAKRKDQTSEIIREFSVADAKNANLWGKVNKDGSGSVWKKYPKRMLQMRARSWCLRDGFGDVIKGLHVAEEVIDMVEVTSAKEKAKDLTDQIKKGDTENPVEYTVEKEETPVTDDSGPEGDEADPIEGLVVEISRWMRINQKREKLCLEHPDSRVQWAFFKRFKELKGVDHPSVAPTTVIPEEAEEAGEPSLIEKAEIEAQEIIIGIDVNEDTGFINIHGFAAVCNNFARNLPKDIFNEAMNFKDAVDVPENERENVIHRLCKAGL